MTPPFEPNSLQWLFLAAIALGVIALALAAGAGWLALRRRRTGSRSASAGAGGRALADTTLSTSTGTAQDMDVTQPGSELMRDLEYRVGRRTDVGRRRGHNEDSLLTIEVVRNRLSANLPIGIYAVADGMGGHAAGEVASGAIVSVLAQKAFADLVPAAGAAAESDRAGWLREAVAAAGQAVFNLRSTSGTDMGSTLVLALLEGNRAHVAHVGDSRAYLFTTQGIRQLTADHSLVERLVAANQITAEEARRHPQRHVVYRIIGDQPNVAPDVSTFQLASGDRLLLCSDGLSGKLEDEEIRAIVMEQSASPQEGCDKLVQAANDAGGEDNITAVLIEIVY